jgi:RNA polymerase primary sigma factor
VREAARAVTSLDKPIGDGDGELGDMLAVTTDSVPEDEIIVSLEEEVLRRAGVRPRVQPVAV